MFKFMFSFLLPIFHTDKLICTKKEKYCKMEPSGFCGYLNSPLRRSKKNSACIKTHRDQLKIYISQVTLSKKNRTVDQPIPDFQIRNKPSNFIQSTELSQGCQEKEWFLQ